MLAALGGVAAGAFAAAGDEHRDGVAALRVGADQPRRLGAHVVEQVRQRRVVDAGRVVARWQHGADDVNGWDEDRRIVGVRAGCVRPDQRAPSTCDAAVVAIDDAAVQLPVAQADAVGRATAGRRRSRTPGRRRGDATCGLVCRILSRPNLVEVVFSVIAWIERRLGHAQPGLLVEARCTRQSRDRIADDGDVVALNFCGADDVHCKPWYTGGTERSCCRR